VDVGNFQFSRIKRLDFRIEVIHHVRIIRNPDQK
jgi:hypothetical protein